MCQQRQKKQLWCRYQDKSNKQTRRAAEVWTELLIVAGVAAAAEEKLVAQHGAATCHLTAVVSECQRQHVTEILAALDICDSQRRMQLEKRQQKSHQQNQHLTVTTIA